MGLVALVLGCAGSSTTTDAEERETSQREAVGPQELIVDMNVAPAQLDPSNNTGLNDTIVGNFYVRLTDLGTRPGPDGTLEVDPTVIEPYLAESWEISADGRTYTFNLREGVTFPSGNPVDAEAVTYSFERALTMGLAGAYFLEDGIPGNIASIEAPDPTTVVITVKEPDPNLLQAWSAPPASIVDPSVVEANGGVQEGEPNEWMASHVAGSGPFLLESYEPNARMVLTRNPDFFGEAPWAERIVVNFITSQETLLLRARSGQSDVTLGLTPQALRSLEGSDDVRIVANGTTLTEWLGFVNGTPPLDNLKLRQALATAVPYEDLLDEIAHGYGSLYFGPIPPAMPFYADLPNPYEFDIEAAKKLIDESGLSQPIDLTMLIQAGNSREEQIATVLQGVWREIGVNLSIDRRSPSEYINLLTAHEDVQTFLREDGPGVIDAGYYLDYDMRCDIGFNLAEICIPEADALLTTARHTQSEEERAELYRQISELWIAEVPKVPLYQVQAAAVLKQDVETYVFNQIAPEFRRWAK